MNELTKDLVYARFLEAADVLRRLPPVKSPKAFGCAMPDFLREEIDDDRDPKQWAWPERLEPASAAQISRADEVLDWTLKYLMDWPRHRGCAPRQALWGVAICAMWGRSFSLECRKRSWSRTTAWRRMGLALQAVQDGLLKDGILFRMPDVDYLEQLKQKSAS